MNKQLFTKRSDVISLVVVSGHLMAVLAPVFLVAALGTGWYVLLCYLLFGVSMNGVLNLMHECAHYHVFKAREWSTILGRWVIAPMVFANFDTYRERHWAHHKFIGVAGDTKDTYLIPIDRWHVAALLARCVTMVEAARKFFKQGGTEAAASGSRLTWMANIIAFHTALLVALVATSRLANASAAWAHTILTVGVAYGLVYLYGLMSVTVFMAALRAIAEHQQYDDVSAAEGYAALRNFKCNPLSRYMMGAYGFGEHFTHHVVPGIPYYHLRTATAEMSAENALLRPAKGYFRVLAEIATHRRNETVARNDD